MKELVPKAFDPAAAKQAVSKLQATFATGTIRKERADILPLFRLNPQVSMAAAKLLNFEASHYAAELNLIGNFAADFAVSDNRGDESTALLIECEAAKENSAMRRNGNKANKDFGDGLLRGFGQVVDWMRCIDDLRRTAVLAKTMQSKLGLNIKCYGLVLVGLNDDLTEDEQKRLQWLSAKLCLADSSVNIMTYTTFFLRLEARLA